MSKKRSRMDSGVRLQISHALPVIAEEHESTTTANVAASTSVTIRPGKRGRYALKVSHGEAEEEEAVSDETPNVSEDYGEDDSGAGLLDEDFGASSQEDTPDSESVREEVEADTSNIKKTVRNYSTSRLARLMRGMIIGLSRA